MGHLVKGRDAGGTRYFLDDRPVAAGTGLELRLPGDPGGAIAVRQIADRYVTDGPHRRLLEQAADDLAERWIRVRFETEGDNAVLYVPFGGAWEAWRPPAGQREGDEVEIACASCAGTGRRFPGDPCERCDGKGELRGLVIGEPDQAVPCDHAHHGRRIGAVLEDTEIECVNGRVTVERACSDCDGRGKRWKIVERPYGGQGVVRGSELHLAELRWPPRRLR